MTYNVSSSIFFIIAALVSPTRNPSVSTVEADGISAEALRSHDLRFDRMVTVFAGMEKEATAQAREYFEGAMPTSPQAAILKDGQLVHLMQRQDFLGRSPEEIAATLSSAYRRTVAAS